MNGYQIAIDPQRWGISKTAEIRHHISTIKSILESTASQIDRHCIDGSMPDILVEYDNTGPVCHHQRDLRNRIRIGLNTSYRFWAQQAFQFAHEFGHAIANHSRVGQEHNLKHANKWVEEVICHAASLFSLRQMSIEWMKDPPFTSAQSYSASLSRYAGDIIDAATLSLSPFENFISWFTACEHELRIHPIALEKDAAIKKRLRNHYDVIATKILPLFEAEPSVWSSLSFLNITQTTETDQLKAFLANWKEACPSRLKNFPQQVAGTFGIDLES